MKLEIRLFANLRKIVPRGTKGVFQLELPPESKLKDLIEQLNLPEDQQLIILVNGRREVNNRVLKEGDRIGIFPPVGGG